jgi:hypothetical protein
VVRERATNEEWRVYYERAAELRAVVGDPFKRQLDREALRRRIFILGSTLFVIALVTVCFYLLTTP